MTYGTITNGIDVTITREPITDFGIEQEPVTDLPISQFNQLTTTGVEYRTGLKTNLVKNPSFEAGTTGWQVVSSTISQNTSFSKFGSACLQSVATVTGNNSGARFSSNATYRIPCTTGQVFTASCWVRNLVGTRQIYFQARGFDTATSATALESFGSNVTTSSTFTRIAATFAFTNTLVDFFEIYVRFISTGSIGDTFLADGFVCETGSSNLYYWDGSTSDVPIDYEPVVKWTGAANNSTSLLTYQQEGTLTIDEMVLR